MFDEEARLTYCSVALGSQNIPSHFFKEPGACSSNVAAASSRVLSDTVLSTGPIPAGNTPNAVISDFRETQEDDILDIELVIKNTHTKLIEIIGDLSLDVLSDPETLFKPFLNFTAQLLQKIGAKKTNTGLANALNTLSYKETGKSMHVTTPGRRKYVSRKGTRSVGKGKLPANSFHEVRPVIAPEDNALQVPTRKRKRVHDLIGSVKEKRV